MNQPGHQCGESNHKDYRHTHPHSGLHLSRDTQKGANPEKTLQDEVVH